jgi:hypothetical protein
MANINNPLGFVPKKHGSTEGEAPQNVFAPKGYSIASAYGTSLFCGDPVHITGTSDAEGRPNIAIASPGVVTGVFAGCEYTDSTGKKIYSKKWPASTVATNIVAMVWDHPQTQFSIQVDGASGLAVTDVGQKADFVAGTGNSQTGFSAYVLDSTTISTGDGLLILGLDPVDGNAMGQYANALVVFREHRMAGTYTAV